MVDEIAYVDELNAVGGVVVMRFDYGTWDDTDLKFCSQRLVFLDIG